MAFTLATDLTDIDLAESATPWTTGSLDPDKYVQGSNSIGWYASKNSRSVNGVSSKSIAHAAGDHLYWWNSSDVISKAEAQTTGTTTASGVTIRVTLSDGAYREWHVAGSDTWDGGWRCFVVDLAHTGTHLYASSGTWSTANNITDVDIYVDLSNSGNIRNVPANHYADAIRVGTGVTAYNTSSADASFGYTEIAAAAEATSLAYGVTETIGGVVFVQGHVTVGDTGTNHVDFDSQDEVVVFLERDGTDGYGMVASGLYGIDHTGNATGTDQDISYGVKVGTGDTATARNGTIIRAGGANVDFYVDLCAVSSLHSVTANGLVVKDASGGAYATAEPTTTHEWTGCTFDGDGQVDPGQAVVRNMTMLNSDTLTTSGALLYDETDTDIKNSLFVNNPNAIEMPAGSVTGDITFDGMEFTGNTYDVRNENTTPATANLNWSNASSAPTINNTGAQTLTAVNTVTLTLTNVVVGSQCAIYAGAGGYETEGTELMNETAVSTTVTEPYAYVSSQPIVVRVRNSSAATRYFPYNAAGTVTGNFTLRIDQIEDLIAE